MSPCLLVLLTQGRGLDAETVFQYSPRPQPRIPTRSLFEMLLAGGPVMIPILLASFLMLLIVFERMISLRRRRVVPRLFIERFLLQVREGALDRDEALERCEDEFKSYRPRVCGRHPQMGQAGRRSGTSCARRGRTNRQCVAALLARAQRRVHRFAAARATWARSWGMIQAFNVIANSAAMGRTEMLAGGISVALITTASGLLVAIPALIFYLYFVGRVDGLIMEIDHYGQELVNLISHRRPRRPQIHAAHDRPQESSVKSRGSRVESRGPEH